MEWGSSTVRAELAALEAAGYLTHPHTSAGRIPTELGYRYYVDRLIEGGALSAAVGVELELSRLRREIDEAMRETTSALARVNDLMALVTAPPLGETLYMHGVSRLLSAEHLAELPQVDELMGALERRADVLGMLRSALDRELGLPLDRRRESAAGAALGQRRRRQLRRRPAQPRLGRRGRPAADGLRDRDRLGARRGGPALALLRDGLTADASADYYETSASRATQTRPSSRRPFAGSPASCTPTSTPTIPRPRRSSRRRRKPTRCSPTRSDATPTTPTAPRGCAAPAPRLVASARSRTSSRPSSAATSASRCGAGRCAAKT